MSNHITAKDIIAKTQAHCNRLGIKPKREKYLHLILQEAEKVKLTASELKMLTQHLGIPWSDPPKDARGWIPS